MKDTEELWALSHAKFLLQHIRIRHDLLWHDIKKQFCFFLYPKLNEGFIFHLWLMPKFIIMYFFKHLHCVMHHCLYSSAAHNPLIIWFSEVLILYLLGFFSFPLISLISALSVTWFWQLHGAFPQAKRAEQSSLSREGAPSHACSIEVWWARRRRWPLPQPWTQFTSAMLVSRTAELPWTPPTKPLFASLPCPSDSLLVGEAALDKTKN